MIEGIPFHAWSQETAEEILGSACKIDSSVPETAGRSNLSLFKLRAWCVQPDDIPVDKRLWIPEPELEDPRQRHTSFHQFLEYSTLIHIGRLWDFNAPENWRRSSSFQKAVVRAVCRRALVAPQVEVCGKSCRGRVVLETQWAAHLGPLAVVRRVDPTRRFWMAGWGHLTRGF